MQAVQFSIKKFFIQIGMTVMMCAFSMPTFAVSKQLQAVRITGASNKARIVLELEEPLTYRTLSLRTPERFVVDLPNAYTHLTAEDIPHQSTFIKQIRIAKGQGDNLRLVFDLQQEAKAHVFVLSNAKPPLKRLVIDLTAPMEKGDVITPVVVKEKEESPPEVKTKTQAPVLTDKTERVRDVIVTIDAGHGGKDPGAMGANGTKEKNIVLAIAQQLADLINREPGMHAVMTRDDDYYIGLRQRLTAARKHNADIFIAIHADAYNKRDSFGASVFALSPHGASSEAARWLAERENHSELGDVTLTDKSLMLRSVLLDLSQTATIVDSLHLGDAVLTNLGKMTRLHNQKVEQAQFVVLKSPDIPSILVETGFITNPDEEEKLSNASYRDALARAITRGVVAYFFAHPPSGTLFANRTNHQDVA